MVKASLRNSYLLLLFIIFSFILNETVIIGNDFIAKATDMMLSGQKIYFSDFIKPLLCMIAFGIFLSIAITKVKCADRLSSDSIISVFSSTAMALGIVILSQQGGFAKYSYYLIGDILTITQKDLYLIIVTLIVCYIVWILLYNDLLLVSINRSFAVSRGINAVFTENVFVILVAITVMISIKWLGILTINSLLILPAAAARNISRNAKSYHIITMFIAWIACLGGLLFSYEWGTSAGASIVLVAAVIFFITFFISANSTI